eukprot:gnl/TRDRNA2_/TRDRNA2_33368_c0_seq1.p1 gnl/TRDRNA2_/TRDRNA2_33368_c0~~gnl/TRDRNA2_/TRDRNA2_33368_c0_seq1.p1  ORF type:complete len:261 (+),score=19.03 gnl/TRDRNA2_/TRDRNA2_33368_c0_seq1:112-894(+)
MWSTCVLVLFAVRRGDAFRSGVGRHATETTSIESETMSTTTLSFQPVPAGDSRGAPAKAEGLQDDTLHRLRKKIEDLENEQRLATARLSDRSKWSPGVVSVLAVEAGARALRFWSRALGGICVAVNLMAGLKGGKFTAPMFSFIIADVVASTVAAAAKHAAIRMLPSTRGGSHRETIGNSTRSPSAAAPKSRFATLCGWLLPNDFIAPGPPEVVSIWAAALVGLSVGCMTTFATLRCWRDGAIGHRHNALTLGEESLLAA